MLLILLGTVAAILILALSYRALRRGKIAKRTSISAPNGIVEGRFVSIGGIEQWVQIRGEDQGNPIILVLHGGPGVSYIPLGEPFRCWEKDFTVVHWDQRGAGKTFGRNGAKGGGEMTIDRMVEDGIEVVEFLRERLGQDKITLFAHSWGTILGIPMVQRRPELFSAYIGAGQVVSMSRSEIVSYDLLAKRVQAKGEEKTSKAFANVGRPPYTDPKPWMVKQRWIMLTTPKTESDEKLPDIFTAALFEPTYSLGDAMNWMRAFSFSTKVLFGQFMSYDVGQLSPHFEVPILILQGDADLQAPAQTVEEYFATIEATAKELMILKGEGHTAVLSMPETFLREMLRFLG